MCLCACKERAFCEVCSSLRPHLVVVDSGFEVAQRAWQASTTFWTGEQSMTLRVVFGTFAWVVLCASLCACGQDAPPSGVEDRPCVSDRDCPGTTVCVDGECALVDDDDAGVFDPGDTSPPPDVPERPETNVGDPCDDGDDCESGFCIEVTGGDGQRICTDFCNPNDEETCPEGYVCAAVANSGADRIFLCFPESDFLCKTCQSDTDCGGLSDLCVGLADGNFCGRSCANRPCPEGYDCIQGGGDTAPQCQPTSGFCSSCIDNDGDGFGVGPDCLDDDCDDGDRNVNADAQELCNLLDDDCDDQVDEGFDLQSDPDHCGQCDNACALAQATAICTDGACAVGACDEGWGDCNGQPEDGCETDLNAPESCGACAELGGVPGTACGTCDEGIWGCADTENVVCEGDPGMARLNACGGCDVLEDAPGDACGTCNSGALVCDGNDALVCAGDLGDEALNACGGCATLDGQPTEPCGACDAGTYVCATPEELICFGDPGPDAINACGGCQALDDAPGDACGACDLGTLVCEGSDALRCEGDPGPGAVNACGGCSALPHQPGTACGTCGTGQYVCEGQNAVACVGDQGDDAFNACGGCGDLPNEPNTPCGRCGLDRYVCDGPEATECNGDTPSNACGGCGQLGGVLGGDCGTCDQGEFVCNGVDALSCQGDPGPGALNACGGCATLNQTPNTPCGTCNSGRYACNGPDAVSCVGDQGDNARNACGGCGDLANEPNTPCGRCGLDQYVCNGPEATQCNGDTPINGCGGCGQLSPLPGTSCGVCGDGEYVCNGREAVQCADVPPPAESCNLFDDDCDGQIDEGIPGGCTVSIHRSVNRSTGLHFYTTSRTEAQCCGFTVESFDYFSLYRNPAPGLAAFYRCFSDGRHFYTTSSTCELLGAGALEGRIGYIATSQVPGSVQLYRAFRPRNGDHLYTTSLAEFNDAIRNGGYTGEPSAGWVFP